MNLWRAGSVSILLLTVALAPAVDAANVNYAGLVYSGNPNVGAQSGMFKMSVSPNRKFSGQMLIGDRSAGFSGRFNTNGAADIVVKMTVDNSCYYCDPPVIDIEQHSLWDVHFQLLDGGGSISGGLRFRHGGFPDGTLSGKRSGFNRTSPVPASGKFTFVVSGSGDPANTNFPTGNGFGTITIGSPGWVDLAGSLADKLTFSQSTLLCDDGTFPMFASLYNGRGLIQGWAGLTNNPAADVIGDVIWVRPSFARLSFYPAGFTNELAVVGSRYVRTNPVLDWTNGVVIFQGAQLSSPFTDAVLLNAKSTVANMSDNRLALKIKLSSGRFSGSVNEPITGDRISFTGVVLQKQGSGYGYFPEAPLSGQVLLGSAVP